MDNLFFNTNASIFSNNEFSIAFSDKDGKFLFGVKKNGEFEFSSGIPAPVKKQFLEVQNKLSKLEKGVVFEKLNFSNGYYNVTDTPKQYNTAPVSVSSSADYVCFKTNVKKGDLVTITGRGAISARLWVVTDKNNKIIQCSNANQSLFGETIYIPVEGFLLVSARKNYPYFAAIVRVGKGFDILAEEYKSAFDFTLSRKYGIEYANAQSCVKLLNYAGNNQNVHPKVLFIKEGFGGHKYWMGYTPYPGGSSVYENPCVAFSDDGFLWYEINGNPIKDEFSKEGNTVLSYGSDTHLVYRQDLHRLELWWRKVIDYEPKHEILYRSLSTDGQTWTEPEEVFVSSALADVLSPAAIYQNDSYVMWVVEGTGGAKIKKYVGIEESGIWTWTLEQTIELTFTRENISYYPWHLDVDYVNGEYVMCVMCKESNSGPNWDLFLSLSSDGQTWSTPEALAIGNPDGWDQQMYRSSILYNPEDCEYRLYYSARTSSNFVYGLGIATGKKLKRLFGKTTIGE